MMHPEPIPVLARGKGWIAVEKPCGMSVHNQPGQDLISRVTRILSLESPVDEPGFPGPDARIQPVHRLDMETSGVLLLALDLETLRYLSGEFEQGRVTKTYVALVHGQVPVPDTPDRVGVWDSPLSKTSSGRTDPVGKGKTVPARTGFRILGCSFHYTLLEIRLFTGRQHQIRRHAKISGHPVTGDARYGSRRAVSWLRSHRSFDRLGLHAHSMAFVPPGKTGAVTVMSMGIPAQMLDLIETDGEAC
ncbi:MAG: RNA pseudouridine synthase [Pseudomonadota bacterium]